jgi:hypothetical protein
MRRRAIAVLAAGFALIVLAVVLVLSGSDYRTLDSNRVGFDQFVTEVPPRQTACQQLEEVPAGAGRVRVTAGDRGLRPTPQLRFVFSSEGRIVARATLRAGWREGKVSVPLARDVPRAVSGAQWCVTNQGRVPVLFAGQPGNAATFNAVIEGQLTPGRMRLDYLTRDKRSWWAQAGVMIDRFGVGKAQHFGGWVLWAALVALLAAWAVSVRLLLRLAGDEEPA